jgi:hypothetical protein
MFIEIGVQTRRHAQLLQNMDGGAVLAQRARADVLIASNFKAIFLQARAASVAMPIPQTLLSLEYDTVKHPTAKAGGFDDPVESLASSRPEGC